MSEYKPLTQRGEDLWLSGVDEATVREFETVREHKAQQELVRRHPDAGRPGAMERISAEFATDPQRYLRRVKHEEMEDIYEDAYFRAMARPAPAGGERGNLGGTVANPRDYADRDAQRTAVQKLTDRGVPELHAARQIFGEEWRRAVSHPDNEQL
jgi:hypothetical protein